MRMLGRVSMCMMGVMGFGGMVEAQATKQLPADPTLILKVNNSDAVSAKAGKMMQQLGLVSFLPDLKDPIGFAKKTMGIKDGFDGKGDMAVGVYINPANPNDAKGMFLIPVTDYKKFTGNLANLKDEGAGVSSFVFKEGAETMYVMSRGTYAAISNEKEFLAKPAGATIAGAAVLSQLDKSDVAFYANTRQLADMAQPQLKQVRPMALTEIETSLNREPAFDKKFIPAVKELVNQGFNMIDDVLTDTTAATVSMNLSDKGIVFTTVADFKPTGKVGAMVSKLKGNGDPGTLTGLPQTKYFMTAALAMDFKPVVDFAAGYLDPVSKELTGAGENGKKFQDLYENIKKGMLATQSTTVGYVKPTGPIGQQSVLQQVSVVKGDIATLKAVQDKTTQGVMEMTNMLQGAANSGMKTEIVVDKGAAKIAGGTFDKISVKYIVDPANPAAQQAKQIIDMMYGPNGMNGIQGEVDAKTFIAALGGDDKLSESLIASAKANSTALSQSSIIKASASMLPAQKLAVAYVHPDNIANTVVAFLSGQGMRVPFKMTEDTAPMGMSFSAEGSAIRMDMALPNDLIESIVVSVKQVIGQAAGGNM